jgi:hypothetical protein
MGGYVELLSRLATLVAMISHGNTAGRLPFATLASCLLLPSDFLSKCVNSLGKRVISFSERGFLQRHFIAFQAFPLNRLGTCV